jgi:hypothetical protein
MCCFKAWYQAEEDLYVLQCTECRTYQVRFRSASFLFDPFAYIAFRDFVSTTWDLAQTDEIDGSVAIPTSNAGMDLLLSFSQLQELHLLLDSADTEIRTVQLTSLFKDGEHG